MAEIKKYLSNIKNAVFGKEVRSSIHDGIDAINKEVESTTKRQDALEKIHQQLIINAGDSNAEVVDARVDKTTGQSFATMGERLDSATEQFIKTDQKLNETNAQLSDMQRLKITESVVKNKSKKQLVDTYKEINEKNNQANILTVSTFNIRGFDDKKRANIIKALNTIYTSCCDVCCIQEYLTSPNFNTDNTLLTEEFVDIYFRQSITKPHGKYGLFMIANKDLNDRSGGDYRNIGSDGEQRCFQKASYTFNGKKISVYNTHLSYGSSDITVSQLSQLFDTLVADNSLYKIVCGDFNTEILSSYDIFTQNGFKLANNGSFKTYKTTQTAIDNIIVSSVGTIG